MFSQIIYSINESVGPAQPLLVLSNPSSMDITIQVRAIPGTATGKHIKGSSRGVSQVYSQVY